jgi:hypothetical protein
MRTLVHVTIYYPIEIVYWIRLCKYWKQQKLLYSHYELWVNRGLTMWKAETSGMNAVSREQQNTRTEWNKHMLWTEHGRILRIAKHNLLKGRNSPGRPHRRWRLSHTGENRPIASEKRNKRILNTKLHPHRKNLHVNRSRWGDGRTWRSQQIVAYAKPA